MTIKLKNTGNTVIYTATKVTNLKGAIAAAKAAGASFRHINLSYSELDHVDFSGLDLSGASFVSSNLASAKLVGCILAGTDFSRANLNLANLSKSIGTAEFTHASLAQTDLTGLKDAKHIIASTRIVPQKGAFTGFKQLSNKKICELLIPASAKRVGGLYGRKCRASVAIVVKGSGASIHDPSFKYAPGKTVKPQRPFADNDEECQSGIHFFLTKEEAENYS